MKEETNAIMWLGWLVGWLRREGEESRRVCEAASREPGADVEFAVYNVS